MPAEPVKRCQCLPAAPPILLPEPQSGFYFEYYDHAGVDSGVWPGVKRVNLFLFMGGSRDGDSEETDSLRDDEAVPVGFFADRAAFSFFRWVAAMRTGHTDIAGAFFIMTKEQEMLAIKLVNMPDGMLAIIKTFHYRMVEYFHFWGLKDA